MWLADSIRSVLAQTYQDFELIVVDNSKCSASSGYVTSCLSLFTDNRLRRVASFPAGLSRARNVGIRFSRGDVIFFIDDDDIWLKHKLCIQLEEMRKFEVQIHFGNIRLMDKSSSPLVDIIVNSVSRLPNALNISCMSPPSAWAIHKSVFMQVGLFDERFSSTEDKELFVRFQQHFTLARSGPVVIHYRISPSAMSRSIKPKALNNLRLLRLHRSFLLSLPGRSLKFYLFALKALLLSRKYYGMRLLCMSHIRYSKNKLISIALLVMLSFLLFLPNKVARDMS